MGQENAIVMIFFAGMTRIFLRKVIVSALHDKIRESKSAGKEWKSYGQPDKQDNPQSF